MEPAWLLGAHQLETHQHGEASALELLESLCQHEKQHSTTVTTEKGMPLEAELFSRRLKPGNFQ
eukprot:6386280-Amphidinium_carterae.1